MILYGSYNQLTNQLFSCFMYSQKFNPYGQFPSKNSQQLQEEFDEEESEPLIQEVDSNYEPTDKEVREFAVETLGMILPEDEGLLYLAREGLKAPLPPNWVPYQSRDGEVYYKHRITQQKTFDHPTDIEYRKKYQQQKEKMARKNLKSMNMKGTSQFGSASNSNLYGNSSSLLQPKPVNAALIGGGASNLSQTASEQLAVVKLDPKIQQQFEQQLQALEERLKREWAQFQREQRQKHEKKMKKTKQDHEMQLDSLLRGKSKEQKMDDKLIAEKNKMKEQMEEYLTSHLEVEIREYERGQESKLAEFTSVHQEDSKLKLNKHQLEIEHQLQIKQRQHQQTLSNLQQLKQQKKQQQAQLLLKLKSELQSSSHPDIEQATQQAISQQLASVKAGYQQKLKQKQQQLQLEYVQTKKILGHDQNAYLTDLAGKKARMRNISDLKIESIKKKQTQMIVGQFQSQYEELSGKIMEQFQQQFSSLMVEQRRRQEQKLSKEKEKVDKLVKEKTQKQIQNIYMELKSKNKQYQTEMNKKIGVLQQQLIQQFQHKQSSQEDITKKLTLREKEMSLENKQQLVVALGRQRQLENITYDLLKLQQSLAQCDTSQAIDHALMQLAKQYQLQYRTQQYLEHEQQYKALKNKYQQDKQFLTSVMQSLQQPSKSSLSNNSLLKLYNQDVRTMRENDCLLKEVAALLKKAEVNDKQALAELAGKDIRYQEIQLKKEIGKGSNHPYALTELDEDISKGRRNIETSSTGRDIGSAIKEHSKFLSTMRHQLNRKLYQLRSSTYF